MTPDTPAIRTYFAKLGLSTEIADLYIALHEYGAQTISELSRNASVERTRIYRLIDQLLDSGLVEVATHAKRATMQAAPISNLRILISRREQELQSLQDELHMVEQVLGRNSLSTPAARLQMYAGPHSVTQALLQIRHATTEVCLYSTGIYPSIPTSQLREWRAALETAGVAVRILRSGAQDDRLFPVATSGQTNNVSSRSIDQAIYPITHTSVVYDDISLDLLQQDGEWYALKTDNKTLAQDRRGMFEIIWNKAA